MQQSILSNLLAIIVLLLHSLCDTIWRVKLLVELSFLLCMLHICIVVQIGFFGLSGTANAANV